MRIVKNPDRIDKDYRETIEDLSALIHYAHAISNFVGSKAVSSEREWYAAAIFSKILSQCITLHRLLPSGLAVTANNDSVLWDLASACCIARAVIEAYDALAYIALHPDNIEIVSLRIKLWELHDTERRVKMLHLIGSTSPHVQQIEAEEAQLRLELLSEPLVAMLHTSVVGKIRSCETPDFIIPLEARCKASKISYEYYINAKMFLSSHVHTHPFSIHQSMNFCTGDSSSLVLLSLPARYAMVFLAKTIEGMRTLFGGSLPEADEHTNNTLRIWIEILENGVCQRGAT
ncbi:hypothetical protein [Rheinheimera sp.]|uniref:hypothetical protein n=1 Tax=Rheinheimera sp. TaxID=1869214 RepID=UPI003D2C05E2